MGSHMCYHAKSGRSASKIVGIHRREPPRAPKTGERTRSTSISSRFALNVIHSYVELVSRRRRNHRADRAIVNTAAFIIVTAVNAAVVVILPCHALVP